MTNLVARLDPDVATYFKNKPGLDLSNIPLARKTMKTMVANGQPPPSDRILREDVRAPGAGEDPAVRLRVYRRQNENAMISPCVLWIHGGGHCLGDIDQDDFTAEQLVEQVGCVVVSVDWRRAPEHPFPAALNDCYAALGWVHTNAANHGFDPDRVAVAGASSGGGLAAGLALLARDRGEFGLCYQSLSAPMLDDRNQTQSSHTIDHPRVWNRETNLLAWRAYLGETRLDTVSPYAAPAREVSLSGLPPTFIGVGDLDLFLDEDIDYAQRLLQADVPTELHVYPGAPHGFDVFASSSALAQRFFRDRADALRRALSA